MRDDNDHNNDQNNDHNNDQNNNQHRRTIRHLVLAGGGPILLQQLGALHHLDVHHRDVFSLSNVESIYGTSAGAMVGALLALRMDWSEVLEYIFQRPWQEVWSPRPEHWLSLWEQRGLFGEDIFLKVFKPVLKSRKLPIDIHLSAFRTATGVDLHVFALALGTHTVRNVCADTCPDMPLLTALHMSSAIPVLFSPVFWRGEWFVDGGFVCNCPIRHCIQDGHAVSDVLCLDVAAAAAAAAATTTATPAASDILGPDATLVELVTTFLSRALFAPSRADADQPLSPDILRIECDPMPVDMKAWHDIAHSERLRRHWFARGEACAARWIASPQVVNAFLLRLPLPLLPSISLAPPAAASPPPLDSAKGFVEEGE